MLTLSEILHKLKKFLKESCDFYFDATNEKRSATSLRRDVFSRRIDEIFAAMSEKVFLSVGSVRVESVDLPRVDVHPVLSVVRKRDAECDEVVADPLRHVFTQLLFFDSVFVKRRHEVRQRSRHAKCDFLKKKRNCKFVFQSLLIHSKQQPG